MHPQIVQESFGTCPICGMDLVPVNQAGAEQEIMLSNRQIALANIRVEPLSPGNLGNNTFVTGKLAADQELIDVVSSRVPGRIEKLYIKETGRQISKGQPLYEMYSEELLTLQNEYLLTLEQYRQLGDTDKRYASFMEAARKKLLLYGMTADQVKRLGETKARSALVTFGSPVSGIVTEIAAAEGQYVAEGSILYRIEGLDRLWVEAELYPREAALVKEGDQVRVIVAGYEHEPLSGKVVFLNPEYRTGTQILTLRAQIANPGKRFLPGMQASVVLSNNTRTVLALPVDAVVRGEHGAHVWVKAGEGTFTPRMVKTGMETFDRVEILEGLQEGDSVVTSGAYLLYGELVLKKGIEPATAHRYESDEL
ncbi:efflux RND transporter periplasmic adaptor subunit [Anseongella ginsenosidimutans]|nr:efflux RND transporter periplasmic adaptor subunit [Anseongella ginsenosidimutans]